MNKILMIVVCLVIGTNTYASRPEQEQDQRQYQDQIQEQYQDQDQNQEQGQSQSMGDQQNEQSMSFNVEGQASSANAPSVFASSPCSMGGSAALGLKGVNFGGGRTTIDPQCEARELARLFLAAGERELAITLLCTTDAAKVLESCKPSITQETLRVKINTLLIERQHDRDVCNKSKDRILKGCTDK